MKGDYNKVISYKGKRLRLKIRAIGSSVTITSLNLPILKNSEADFVAAGRVNIRIDKANYSSVIQNIQQDWEELVIKGESVDSTDTSPTKRNNLRRGDKPTNSRAKKPDKRKGDSASVCVSTGGGELSASGGDGDRDNPLDTRGSKKDSK